MDPEQKEVEGKDFGELMNGIWEQYSRVRMDLAQSASTVGYITALLFANYGPSGRTEKGIIVAEDDPRDMVEKVCKFYHERVKKLEIYLAQANSCEKEQCDRNG